MSLGKQKLFEIRLKGINRGNLARNSSPGVTYVVSTSIDKAYNAICLLYGNDPNYTDIKDFELESVKLIADESNPNTCLSDSYKLIVADDFYDKFSNGNQIDIDAIKDFIQEENNEDLLNDESYEE